MRIAANPLRETVARHPEHLAWMFSPDMHHTRNRMGLPLYCDNGAFSGLNIPKWSRMLDKFALESEWNVVPDVVADHEGTLALWDVYAHKVPSPAFVGQDGCTPDAIPENAVCFFVGGSTEWKLSQEAVLCVRAAQARGLKTHIGRVNTLRRLNYAHSLGVDSVDGSGFVRWPDRLDWAVAHLKQLDAQMTLF